jgi:3-hydroxyisobutyrate dehydrogenase-like beta-hydroxyacid dehydrogenase
MGEPMALNRTRAGLHRVVGNRNPQKSLILRGAGAAAADGPGEAFVRCDPVLTLLVAMVAGTPGDREQVPPPLAPYAGRRSCAVRCQPEHS